MYKCQDKLTLTWISPQVPKLTLKISVRGGESEGRVTTRRHCSSLLWPFTYSTPLKPFSVMWISTCTPSDRQLTTMSGRGKSVRKCDVVSESTNTNISDSLWVFVHVVTNWAYCPGEYYMDLLTIWVLFHKYVDVGLGKFVTLIIIIIYLVLGFNVIFICRCILCKIKYTITYTE